MTFRSLKCAFYNYSMCVCVIVLKVRICLIKYDNTQKTLYRFIRNYSDVEKTMLNARFVFFHSNRRKVALICRRRRRRRTMTKTTNMKADLGGGESIAIHHQLLSRKIGGYFFALTCR